MTTDAPRRRTMRTILIVVASIGLVFVALIGVCIYVAVSWVADLGPHYEVRGGKVYWTRIAAHTMKKVESEVSEADPNTFEPYGFPRVHYGRDKEHVFFEGRLLRGASPDTFEIVDHTNEISRDGDIEFEGSRRVRHDSVKFVLLGKGYSKDIHGVYWYDRTIPGVDLATFELIDTAWQTGKKGGSGSYARDKDRVYCNARVLEGADPEAFEVLGGDYGKDSERVYYQHELLDGTNAAEFRHDYHDRFYIIGTDGERIYQHGRLVELPDES